MHRTFILRDEAIVERACAFLRSAYNPEHPVAVIVTDADKARTREQNDKLHRMLRTLQDEAWLNGKQGSLEDWKRYLLVRLGFVDTHVNALTGEMSVSPESTSAMSVRKLGELIDKIHFVAATELGVEL